jgi:hypothetical protein
MKKLTWRGQDCVVVSPIVTMRCHGCLFVNAEDDECPHTDESVPMSCDSDNDVIFIEDTPEALAAYAAQKLEGT